MTIEHEVNDNGMQAIITQIKEGSPAFTAGVKAGDILTHFHTTEIEGTTATNTRY